jgi:enoyl-CoA hydratase
MGRALNLPMTPAPPSQLLHWAAAPDAAPTFSAFGPQPWLLLEARSASLSAAEQAQITHWLRRLPCPTLGICIETGDPLTQACDVLVASVAEAAPLIENIHRNPVAAAVLMQTLRLTENQPVLEALDVESLAYATLQGGAEFKRWLEKNKAASPAVPTDHGPAVMVERTDDTLILELNRASNRNAINVEMRDALIEALQLALADDSIRRIRLSGRGKCFSVGGDLSEFGTLPDPASAHVIRALTMPGRFLAQCAARVECHVHGACIGSGVELPAFCKRVTAAPNTFFHLPELQFGLLPGGGGCVSIPRRIGRQRTAWWVLSGRRITARTALEWGLVDEILGSS